MKTILEFWATVEGIGIGLFVVLTPIFLMIHLAVADRVWLFAGVASAWVASVAIIAWEVYRRRLSLVSLSVVILWLIVGLYAVAA
jgi:hypothetical protein